MSTRCHTTVDSPVGPVTLVDDDGALVGCWAGTAAELPARAEPGHRDDTVQPAAREQLAAYFAGELREFDLPLELRGTPFQTRVWAALRTIPYGRTCSYGELALEIGQPTASRAVGLANGRNPVGIVVPCHRVIGAGGKLTGYAGGLDRKRWLLDHERGGLLALG